MEKGYCGKPSACPENNVEHGKCPDDDKCCLSMPFQENKCKDLGGLCMDECECTDIEAEVLEANSCPSQPSSIICCKPKPPPCEIQINSRTNWNAREARNKRQMHEGPARYVFVHHTDRDTCFTSENCAAAVKDIQDYHMDDPSSIPFFGGRGWDDIGYSFLIGGDGSVWEGRGYNVAGAHTEECNMVGYGVAFLGTCTKAPAENFFGNHNGSNVVEVGFVS